METKANNYNGLKAFGVVLTIVALITGIAAIVRPVQQQIDSLEKQILSLKEDLNKHAAQNDHPWGIKSEIAAMSERFKEIETQFKGLREVNTLMDSEKDGRIDKIEEWILWYERESLLNERGKE